MFVLTVKKIERFIFSLLIEVKTGKLKGVCRREEKNMSRTYIIPFDGSNYSKKALTYALNTCKENDRLILLNVQTPEDNKLLQNIPEEQLEKHYYDEGNKILLEAEKIVRTHTNAILKEVRIGYPSLEIAKIAKKYGAYSIIMGSRGLSPSVGNALGSVTYGIIHIAPCPITIVPYLYEEKQQ